jgi:hypothetical protein
MADGWRGLSSTVRLLRASLLFDWSIRDRDHPICEVQVFINQVEPKLFEDLTWTNRQMESAEAWRMQRFQI